MPMIGLDRHDTGMDSRMTDAMLGKSPLTFDSFASLILDALELEASKIEQSTKLIEDIGLDSVGIYEVLLVVEELGADIDEDAL